MRAESSQRLVQLAVIGPFVLAIAALMALSVVGFEILSATRAYVGGESLWSKARSSATAALRSYAASADTADFRRFEAALAVPLGDRVARLELDKDDPDYEVARRGFLAGQNAAADIDGMVRLYRRFRRVSFMNEAIAAWAEGDRLIAELQRLGADIRARPPAPGDLVEVLQRIDAVEAQLMPAERRFSVTLGRASVTTERLLVTATLVLAALLAAGSLLFVRRSLHAQFEQRRLLAEANRRWELAAEAAGIGVFDWHAQSDRFELDARARAMFDLESEAGPLDRARLREQVHPDDRNTAQSGWDQAFVDRSGPFHRRFRLLRGDLTVRHVELTGLVRERDEPQRTSLVGIVRDITDEVLHARLALEKEAAERAAAARSAFLSRLSHELRTPLNAVLGLAQLMRLDADHPLSAPQDRRAKIILDSGAQLLRLVEDVLDITRIDSGSVALKLAPTDLHEVLRASLNLVEPERASFEIRVVDQFGAQPLRVIADAQRLQQVMINLLSNGCKYNRRGGRLTVTAGTSAARAWFAVSDEGQGLAEHERRELFQPFKRFAPTHGIGGTGLGLVVVKLLVEQMQGSIDVDSTPGSGTCFTVNLPSA